MYTKLKGFLKEETLTNILHGNVDLIGVVFNIVNVQKENKIFFQTKKSMFFVERKNVKYWKIFQILGSPD